MVGFLGMFVSVRVCFMYFGRGRGWPCTGTSSRRLWLFASQRSTPASPAPPGPLPFHPVAQLAANATAAAAFLSDPGFVKANLKHSINGCAAGDVCMCNMTFVLLRARYVVRINKCVQDQGPSLSAAAAAPRCRDQAQNRAFLTPCAPSRPLQVPLLQPAGLRAHPGLPHAPLLDGARRLPRHAHARHGGGRPLPGRPAAAGGQAAARRHAHHRHHVSRVVRLCGII